MDEVRRIRFFVAPLLLLASLAAGMLLDAGWRPVVWNAIRGLPKESITGAITILVSGGIVVFAAGFVIGTMTYVLLRLSFLAVSVFTGGPRQHEAGLTEDTLTTLRRTLRLFDGPGRNRADELYITVAFDHGVLRTLNDGIHNWIVRRWNAFSISATSVTAFAVSLLLGGCLGISMCWWYGVVVVLAIMFSISAILAWRDTMRMLTFQAALPWKMENFYSGSIQRTL